MLPTPGDLPRRIPGAQLGPVPPLATVLAAAYSDARADAVAAYARAVLGDGAE